VKPEEDMKTEHSPKRSNGELLDKLKATRDAARLQVHLLSMDAKKRLRDIEDKLDVFETKIGRESDRVLDGMSAKAREFTEAIGEVLREVDGSPELMTSVEKVMKPSPATCTPADSLNRAAQLMWENDCGAVPVVDWAGQLVGMLTDRDVCVASYTRGLHLSQISVGSTMSEHPCTATPKDSLGHVARLMGERQVRRIPIVEAGKLVGIVSLADIARHVRRNAGRSLPACLALANAVAEISEPANSAPADVGNAAE
jgi:CBS domain-containing protein